MDLNGNLSIVDWKKVEYRIIIVTIINEMDKTIITFIVFLFVSINTYAQALIASSVKIGDLKIFAPLDSINKYIEPPIVIKPFISKNSWEHDTVICNYKNTKLRLVFFNNFSYLYDTKHAISLIGFYSEDKNVKTRTGITLGDDKFDIIKKLDGSILSSHLVKGKDKTYSVLELFDGKYDTYLIFHFKNNTLYAIECNTEKLF